MFKKIKFDLFIKNMELSQVTQTINPPYCIVCVLSASPIKLVFSHQTRKDRTDIRPNPINPLKIDYKAKKKKK